MSNKKQVQRVKPKLSQAAVSSSLLVSTPAQTMMDIGTAPQPFPGLFMNLPVNEVDFFDKNPRKRHDAETYHQIKESIRSTGVQQPVHVTQRPGNSRYILAQGGNTRLQIMKELLAETGDNRFTVIPCIYIEYTSDTDIQIAHLIENEQRQEMCFWDKACAYGEIRDMFQADSERALGLREMESLFLTHGLSLSYKILGLLFFARDTLTELGHLAEYLSNAKTVEIRKCYNQLRDAANADGQEAFAEQWAAALAEWAAEHGSDADLDVPALQAWLNARFNAFLPQEADDEDTAWPEADEEGAPDSSDTVSTRSNLSDKSLDSLLPPQTTPATDDAESGRGGVNPRSDRNIPAVAAIEYDQAATAPLPQFANREDALKPLHRTIKKLLEAVRLPECFKVCSSFPYNFYIEYPDFERIQKEPKQDGVYLIVDNRHPDAGDVWLFLSKISGQGNALYDPMMEHDNPILKLSGDSRLLSAYRDQEVLDQYTQLGIGERPYLVDSLIMWQSTEHPLSGLVSDLLIALKIVNDFGGAQ